MALSGQHWIAGRAEPGVGAAFHAASPETGLDLAPAYHDASPDQIERAAAAAGAAFPAFAAAPAAQRAQLLRRIAALLRDHEPDLVARIGQETAFGAPRVANENLRTIRQLELFAALVEDGGWVEARIDHGDPSRQPPRPDLRSMLVPIGPVAVFGASNFPLAYSVAGGDTASALAAGCPVVVKGHPAHPGTSELVGELCSRAVRELGMPAGTFSLLHGRLPATGAALVRHPAIAAVGFTGSLAGGRALADHAAARPDPIPVFAEMGSMNPVFVLPNALAARAVAIGEQLAASALLAMGQFCTSPGLVAVVDGPGADVLAATLQQKLGAAAAAPAVHASIRRGFEQALAEVKALPVTTLAWGGGGAAATAVCPALLAADGALVLREPRLRHEIYGPAMLLVRCRDAAELLALAQSLHGHLTGTLHGDDRDFVAFADLAAVVRRKVGRLVANGVPTGVEVCGAMVHGGPWPASTDARFSAVGPTAIRRWVRPAAWQDWPDAALPEELREANPRRFRRVVDGVSG
ncbi:MAG: aldehyde dehydrogenase (NADP(+)) [Planctomycetes bacterium]|nr:aldehyde dehydrogenase (NADP(+)) [Planctomycetota bacterium]